MSVTPDKSALEKARERLRELTDVPSQVVVARDGKLHQARYVELADLRLVLDALAEAEREVKRLHELADESRKVTGSLRDYEDYMRRDESEESQ